MIYAPQLFHNQIPQYEESLKAELNEEVSRIYGELISLKERKGGDLEIWVAEMIDKFLSTYVDEQKKEVKLEPVNLVGDFVMKHLEVVREPDLDSVVEAAIQGLEDLRNACFYIPHRYEDVNLWGYTSNNSYEYMIKRAAELVSNSVQWLSVYRGSHVLEGNINVIRVLDDMAYSGSSLVRDLGDLIKKLPARKVKPTIEVFLAGATAKAIAAIKSLGRENKVNIRIFVTREVKSVWELVSEKPELLAFFVGESILRGHITQQDIEGHLRGLTLTRTAHKVADFMSFPTPVTAVYGGEDAVYGKYPDVKQQVLSKIVAV